MLFRFAAMSMAAPPEERRPFANLAPDAMALAEMSEAPAARHSRPQRLVVRTSFGPLEMELPAELSAEDAVRIAAAVLRLAQ